MRVNIEMNKKIEQIRRIRRNCNETLIYSYLYKKIFINIMYKN